VKKADLWFDVTGALILIFHLLLAFPGVYYQVLPIWAFIPLFYITRTSLAAIGHYHDHRRKNGITDWGNALFDM
jgi:hypothetical protein